MPDAEDDGYDEELARHNAMGEDMARNGHQIGGVESEPNHEDAVAHLRVMPPAQAIAKAIEWTRDANIRTLPEAIAAVRRLYGKE
jgi:hypothetical protein